MPSSGVMTSSASANVSATMGSVSRSSRSMLTYCEPWPVYRNAVAGAGPWPMATRTGAAATAGSGGAGGGAWPAAASSRIRASRAATPDSLPPPITRAPRSGCLAPGGGCSPARGGRSTARGGRSPGAAAGGCLAGAGGTGRAGPAAFVAVPPSLRGSAPSYLPGTYSSSTAWKLAPPNPKALTPARRTPPGGRGHSRSSPFTRNGDLAQSALGFGSRKFRLGGSTFSCRAMTCLNKPALPAAPFRWPMFDFTEPSAIEPGASSPGRNTRTRLSSSAASPARVDVPCASTHEAVAGSARALRQARAMASRCPAGFGAVIPLPLPSLDPPMPSSTA